MSEVQKKVTKKKATKKAPVKKVTPEVAKEEPKGKKFFLGNCVKTGEPLYKYL